MAEWPIAPVLKTGSPQGLVGSNPTSSESKTPKKGVFFFGREGAKVKCHARCVQSVGEFLLFLNVMNQKRDTESANI